MVNDITTVSVITYNERRKVKKKKTEQCNTIRHYCKKINKKFDCLSSDIASCSVLEKVRWSLCFMK